MELAKPEFAINLDTIYVVLCKCVSINIWLKFGAKPFIAGVVEEILFGY